MTAFWFGLVLFILLLLLLPFVLMLIAAKTFVYFFRICIRFKKYFARSYVLSWLCWRDVLIYSHFRKIQIVDLKPHVVIHSCLHRTNIILNENQEPRRWIFSHLVCGHVRIQYFDSHTHTHTFTLPHFTWFHIDALNASKTQYLLYSYNLTEDILNGEKDERKTRWTVCSMKY